MSTERESHGRLVLSRFAWLRRDGSAWVAESALTASVVALDDPRALVLLHAFATPTDPEAATAGAQLPSDAGRELVDQLRGAAVLVDEASAQAEQEPPLAVWEFHDLVFHARSRSGRNPAPTGGTYRFAGRFPIEPALPGTRGERTVALPRPDWDRLEQEDAPLARVQSLRSSVRQYGTMPLTIEQLGEFLYRVGRVEDYWKVDFGPGGGGDDFVAKPYPSGGALYELEFYVAARNCTGLDGGLYHYAADGHLLERVTPPGPDLIRLFSSHAGGLGIQPNSLQVLILLTARMGRIAWKYQSIAYSLVLKHVGVVMQTMYLSATAMGLGGCAIGSGDSELFARVSGIDPHEEAAVGEFVLGSRVRSR